MREGGRRGCRFWGLLGRLDLVRSIKCQWRLDKSTLLMLSIFVCLLYSLLFSSLQTTCQPATEFLDQHGFHFPILQLYSLRFFLVSSADQRNLLEEGFVRHTHVHTCILLVSFHEQPTIHSQQGSALAVGLERLGTGVLHLLACSTLEVG